MTTTTEQRRLLTENFIKEDGKMQKSQALFECVTDYKDNVQTLILAALHTLVLQTIVDHKQIGFLVNLFAQGIAFQKQRLEPE